MTDTARLARRRQPASGKVTDEMLLQARDAHLFAYAEYAAQQPLLAAYASASGGPPLYEPVTGETALNQCCGNLLTTIGLELTYPEDSERLRNGRAFMRRPNAATLGFEASA